jgi:leucyl aminopeptidase
MTTKKSGLAIAMLACSSFAFAAPPQQDKEVWITIGAETLPLVSAAFKSKGTELPAAIVEKGGVAALRLRESQLEIISGVMHDKLNRCAGFISHDSQAKALAEVDLASAPAPQASLLAFTINNGPSVNAMMSSVQELNLRSTVNSLSTNWTTRRYNVQSGADAATWLRDQWTSMAAGRTDVSVALFAHSWLQPSVIATITGTTVPNEVVVLGGHLDSINQSSSTGAAPGADDDASGVATITEAFRVAMATGYRPARTVKFMAYAAEEVGLNGSAAIAQWHKNNAVNVVAVLQLDMTNYRGSSWDFGMVSDNTNPSLNTFTTSLITTYLPGMTFTSFACGYACSDHASWTSNGYPSTLPFEATISTDNPNIHTANDTLTFMGGTMNNSVKFAKLAAAFMGETAKGATNGNTPPPTGSVPTATYDATLKAPKCGAAGIGCDSSTLLTGRGNVGPEVNKSNTINATCTDGNSGAFHSDESVDRVKVSTVDGTNLAAGKQVTIEATVWSYSNTADKADIYYTSNASSPTWTLLGTFAPGGTGVRTITANYTLPAGALQAVRVNFRYNGAVSTCTTGAYDDHDDLIFAVQ